MVELAGKVSQIGWEKKIGRAPKDAPGFAGQLRMGKTRSQRD